MKTIKCRAYPVTPLKTCFLANAAADVLVHSAPGHFAVVVECYQSYSKTKNGKLVKHGLRIELPGQAALELIEALAKSLNDVSAGVCR